MAAIFKSMKEEIEEHTKKEDLILFPFIRELGESKHLAEVPFVTVGNPVRCMEKEHSEAGDALFKLRHLTDGYIAPETACASWKALVSGLARLDRDLRIHIHKENSILFPKAIAAEVAAREVW